MMIMMMNNIHCDTILEGNYTVMCTVALAVAERKIL